MDRVTGFTEGNSALNVPDVLCIRPGRRPEPQPYNNSTAKPVNTNEIHGSDRPRATVLAFTRGIVRCSSLGPCATTCPVHPTYVKGAMSDLAKGVSGYRFYP